MGIDRRSFIKFAAGAGVGTAVSPLPWKLLDDVSIWTQNWPWIPANVPGETTWEETTSKYCPSACGMRVRLVNGRPVRAIGDPDHPLGGGLSPLAAAEVQLLYSPARVKSPLRRTPNGTLAPVSWKTAEQILVEKIGAAGAKIACVSGRETGVSLEVLSSFLAGRGSDRLYVMPSEAQTAGRAWKLMGGRGQIGYDLETSDYTLAVGANVLESWGTVIRNRRIFSAARPHGEAPASSFLYAGPVRNQSAAVADQWIPLRPGSELIFLLGLCALLVQQGRTIYAPDFISFREMLSDFTVQKVNTLTDIPIQTLQNTASALLKASRPLVITGSECGQGGGAAPIMAGLALNLLLGGKNLRDIPLSGVLPGAQVRSSIQSKDLTQYIANEDAPQALFFYEANPAYALPNLKATAEFTKSAPFKVSFTPFLDETALLCDLVLPLPFGPEYTDSIESPYGCARPFYALSRKLTDAPEGIIPGPAILANLAVRLGQNPLPPLENILRSKAKILGADFAALNKGAVFESTAFSPGVVTLLPEILRKEAAGKSNAIPILLAPLWRSALGTAQSGIPPFNVKTIRSSEVAGGVLCALLNKATAYSHGLEEGNRVRISTNHGMVTARVRIFEGIVPDAVALSLGFGHTALDAFNRDKGSNVIELLVPTPETETGLSVWNRVGVSIVKI